MPAPLFPAPDRLAALWAGWQTPARRLAVTVRPALLPHLRTVDRDQADDVAATLALSGFRVSATAVDAALAATGTRAHEEGWPGPVPSPVSDPTAARRRIEATALAALDGWADVLVESRLATLTLLQGCAPDEVLPAVLGTWRSVLTHPAVAAGLVPAARADGLRRHAVPDAPEPGEIAACLQRMWTMADGESAWDVRGVLLHLAILWIRPWPGANGRMARLVLNTLRVAAGHRWLSIPGDRADEYAAAVAVALDAGDATPFCTLVHSCSAHSRRPPS